MPPPVNVQNKIYAPVGRCIYCGSTGGPKGLSDEHIVPYSLGANSVLPKASCTECATITSYLDGYLARSVFYDLRLQTGTQTRRPKERPTTRPATIQSGDVKQRLDFPLTEHPHTMVLPVWEPPGITLGIQPSETFSGARAVIFWSIKSGFFERHGFDSQSSVQVPIAINQIAFARAIAKIAYAQIVANLGLDGIRPLYTPSLILGRYKYVPYFVGTDSYEPPPPPSPAFVKHLLEFGLWRHQNLELIYMTVRLFADSGHTNGGMPVYRVIVGASKNESARRVLMCAQN